MTLLAFLQAASDAGAVGGGLAPLLADPDIGAAAQRLLASHGEGDLALMGAALFFVNVLVRKGALQRLPPGKLSDFLNSRLGGWIINLSLALGGGAVTMAGAGSPITIAALGAMALKAGLAAAVAVMVNEFQKDIAKAKDAGKAAAADPAPTINS